MKRPVVQARVSILVTPELVNELWFVNLGRVRTGRACRLSAEGPVPA